MWYTEGFSFPVSGPYQEFPILRSFNDNPYTGGSPGADRVVFNTNCQLAGVITRKTFCDRTPKPWLTLPR